VRSMLLAQQTSSALTSTTDDRDAVIEKGLPNGSRLSCGRNGHARKAVERQIKRLASEATQLFPTGERPSASSAC